MSHTTGICTPSLKSKGQMSKLRSGVCIQSILQILMQNDTNNSDFSYIKQPLMWEEGEKAYKALLI